MLVFVITYRNKLNKYSHVIRAKGSIFSLVSHTRVLHYLRVKAVLIGIAMATNGFFIEGSV